MNTILMFRKDDDIPDMGGVSKKSELFGGGVHEYKLSCLEKMMTYLTWVG